MEEFLHLMNFADGQVFDSITFFMYCAKLDIQDIFHLLKYDLQIEKDSCNKVDDEENNDDINKKRILQNMYCP